MTDKPPDPPRDDQPQIAKDAEGKILTKRMKQTMRDAHAASIAGVMVVDDTYYFAGDFNLLVQYCLDRIVSHASTRGVDPLQIVYDLMHQYGYVEQGSNLILPKGVKDEVSKPDPKTGDGAPRIVLPFAKRTM